MSGQPTIKHADASRIALLLCSQADLVTVMASVLRRALEGGEGASLSLVGMPALDGRAGKATQETLIAAGAGHTLPFKLGATEGLAELAGHAVRSLRDVAELVGRDRHPAKAAVIADALARAAEDAATGMRAACWVPMRRKVVFACVTAVQDACERACEDIGGIPEAERPAFAPLVEAAEILLELADFLDLVAFEAR